jgi:hypothetical protein
MQSTPAVALHGDFDELFGDLVTSEGRRGETTKHEARMSYPPR